MNWFTILIFLCILSIPYTTPFFGLIAGAISAVTGIIGTVSAGVDVYNKISGRNAERAPVNQVNNYITQGVSKAELDELGIQIERGNQEIKVELSVLKQQLEDFSVKIDNLASDLTALGTIEDLLRDLPNQVRLELKLNDLDRYITSIDIAYKHMTTHIMLNFMSKEVYNFANTILSYDENSVRNLLERIHSFLVPTHHQESIFDIIYSRHNKSSAVCEMTESVQQYLIKTYNMVGIAQLKGYMMMQFAYTVNVFVDNSLEINLVQKQHMTRLEQGLKKLYEITKNADRTYRKCDPKTFIENHNYIQITNFLQGVLINEYELSCSRTCKGGCDLYDEINTNSCTYKKQTCKGSVYNCKSLSAYDVETIFVCNSTEANRRIDYVSSSRGITYGNHNNNNCQLTKRDNFLINNEYCSFCMCYCDEQNEKSKKFISIWPVVSDIKTNKVITGIRIARKDSIIRLEIQEGMLENAAINQKSVEWIPSEDYGLSYTTLTYDIRKLDLGDLEAKNANEFLTGVRFNTFEGHVRLEIKVTPFNFVTNKFEDRRSYWIFNAPAKNELNMNDRRIPTKAKISSSISPQNQNDLFIQFMPTSLQEDVAQTMVPFIDIQPVASAIPVPLSGIGIYHKGSPTYGGFIGVKIITYDYSSIFENVLKQLPDLIQRSQQIVIVGNTGNKNALPACIFLQLLLVLFMFSIF